MAVEVISGVVLIILGVVIFGGIIWGAWRLFKLIEQSDMPLGTRSLAYLVGGLVIAGALFLIGNFALR